MICLANPKEDNENNTEWIIACNPDKYDVIGAFHELGSIDWTQSANIVVNLISQMNLMAQRGDIWSWK